MEIKNKVAIVTGASEGIGKEIARQLHAGGAKVVLAARTQKTLAEIEKELPGAVGIQTDMRRPEAIQNLVDSTVQQFGRIDIVINNAGQGMYMPVEKIDIAAYQDIIELNIMGVLRMMQAVIPIMRTQGGGMIVNISSMVSKNYYPGLGAYASTKYALNALSLTARAELADEKIVVSVMHPRMTATRFGENALGESPSWDSDTFKGRPRPEVDSPEDVAARTLELIESEEGEAMMG